MPQGAGGACAAVAIQLKAVIQSYAAQGGGFCKAVIGQARTGGQQVGIKFKLCAAVDLQSPVVRRAAEGEIGMPAVGQRHGGGAGVFGGGGNGEAV